MKEEENFVTYGTPLEPLEEDEAPKKKPIRIEDQIVTDEKGRRRFHGAFTGGFSAGHFNTVGTVEGWAPSTFVSSRVSRGNAKQQRPEDFMDAEDLGQFGIAPRTVHTTKEFRDTQAEANKRKRPYSEPSEGPIPGVAPLRDLIVPANESMGIKLLMKMGWKPGQGIGPRVKYKQKKKKKQMEKANARTFGCAQSEESDDESDDEHAKNFTFAPDDVAAVPYRPKDNVFGLGYTGLDKRPVLSESFSVFGPEVTKIDKKKKIGMRGQAFGVGAFEDEDEDIYHRDDMSNYDFTLEDPKSNVKDRKGVPLTVDQLSKVLEGFQLATKPRPPKKHFPLPLLPRDFKPFHKAHLSSALSRLLSANSHKGMNRHSYSAKERGILLGEKPLPESVFNAISAEDKAKLDQARIATAEPSSSTTVSKETSKPPLPNIAPHVLEDSKQIAKSMSFKPFAKDEAKQKRYEIYLSLSKSGNKDALAALQPAHLTEWEKVREQEEFNKAAQLYRPLAAGMASRFVSAKSLEVETTSEGLSKSGVEKKVLTEQDKAAESKSYGKKTRERLEWHPDKLLCKRFNVPNPYPDSSEVGVRKVKRDKFSIFNFLTMGTQPGTSAQTSVELLEDPAETSETSDEPALPIKPLSSPSREGKISPTISQTRALNEVEIPKMDERPSMDLFKAIFQDSDEETSDDSDAEAAVSSSLLETSGKEKYGGKNELSLNEGKKESVPKRAENVEDPSRQNTQRNPLPARGVFSNLDLDKLCKPVLTSQMIPTTVPTTEASAPSSTAQEMLYGPKLPPPSNANEDKNGIPFSDVKTAKHHHKKHKEKDKHKHRKHKKHKHKSKSKRKTKESSEDSNSDETALEIMERLKRLHKGIK